MIIRNKGKGLKSLKEGAVQCTVFRGDGIGYRPI